jgi:hypothetical protein
MDLGMIDSFGNVLSEDTKWKRASVSPSLLGPVLVQVDNRTWLVFANMMLSSALGALASCFCYGPRINTRSNADLYVGLTLSLALA